MRNQIKALLTGAFFAMSLPVVALAQQQPAVAQEGPWNWPGHWHAWAGSWGFGWIFPLLVLLMIVGCIAMVLGGHRSGAAGRQDPGPSSGDPTRSALQILNERFARGEIRREEYEERKRAILTMIGPTGNL